MSPVSLEILSLVAIFGFIALASRQIGKTAASGGLPLISGYLLAGILTGPYLLRQLREINLEDLRKVYLDEA